MAEVFARQEAYHYRIRVKGVLDSKWAEWFGGMTITPTSPGETLLEGSVIDQAALHGILATIRDLGLVLLLVEKIEADQ